MKAGQDTTKELDGLNIRFNKGVGMGKSYYDAQLKIKMRSMKLGLGGRKRVVMFQDIDEPGPSQH